jgi:hypothetical protein
MDANAPGVGMLRIAAGEVRMCFGHHIKKNADGCAEARKNLTEAAKELSENQREYCYEQLSPLALHAPHPYLARHALLAPAPRPRGLLLRRRPRPGLRPWPARGVRLPRGRPGCSGLQRRGDRLRGLLPVRRQRGGLRRRRRGGGGA